VMNIKIKKTVWMRWIMGLNFLKLSFLY